MAWYDSMPLARAGKQYNKGFDWLGEQLNPQTLSSLDPTQQGLYGQYAQGLSGQGGQFGDLFDFDPSKVRQQYQEQYADPAMQQFQEQTVPGITGSFRGQNLQDSSYLGGALGQAGTNVQKDLNAQLSRMLQGAEQGAMQRKQGGLNQLLGMQTFAYQQSPLMQLLNSLAGGAGKAAGSAMFGGR